MTLPLSEDTRRALHELAQDFRRSWQTYVDLENTLAGAYRLGLRAGEAQGWQPIETAQRGVELFFWIVPKTADEAYVDTSGQPIVSQFSPRFHRGVFGTWGALSKATHWRHLFDPPKTCASAAPGETP